MAAEETLLNPYLEGESFYWLAGSLGVLLVHGFTATTAEVRPLARRLHAMGYTVASPLLPGHGTRPRDLNRVRWQDWVDAAEHAYRNLAARCNSIWVGGESMGALAALYLASEHPEILGTLAFAPAIKLAARPLDVLRLYLSAPFVPSVPKGDVDASGRWQGYPVNPLRGAIQLLRFQGVVRRRLPRIQQPVLVVQGRLDATIDPRSGELICQGISSAVKELHWMERSSHVVILDDELEEVTALTLRFIEGAAGPKQGIKEAPEFKGK